MKQNSFNRFKTVTLILSIGLIGLLLPSISFGEKLKIKPHEAPDPCSANSPQIRVTVNGVGSGGILNVGLYDDPDNF